MRSQETKNQQELAQKSNKILEDVINFEADEIIETQTKFEFNLGFAKVSRSIKKIKNKSSL